MDGELYSGFWQSVSNKLFGKPESDKYSVEKLIVGDSGSVRIDPSSMSVAGFHNHPGGANYFSNKHNSKGVGDAGWVRYYRIPLYMSSMPNNTLEIRVCNFSSASCRVDYRTTYNPATNAAVTYGLDCDLVK